MGQFQLTSTLEESHVSRIRARPAAFDEVDAERVELFGDTTLIVDRKVDALALRSISQSRVINFYSFVHENLSLGYGLFQG